LHDAADFTHLESLALAGQFTLVMARTQAAFINDVFVGASDLMPAMSSTGTLVMMPWLRSLDQHPATHLWTAYCSSFAAGQSPQQSTPRLWLTVGQGVPEWVSTKLH